MQLSKKEIRETLSGVLLTEPNDDDSAASILARIAFSIITEPGDKFAGWLLSNFEPTKVIETLQRGYDFDGLIGNEKREDLVQQFGKPEALFADARERWSPRLKFSLVAAAANSARVLGAKVVAPSDEHWPAGLSALKFSVPHCIWLRGNPKVLALSDRSLALVGSRLATSYGEFATTEIVSAAVGEQLAVISGGAYGIDAVAHRATLALDGFTVAVIAGGIDRLYPSGNLELLDKIAELNALISEQAPGVSPTKWRFLQRNRLIAALGSATVVVEAGYRSGALNTAKHANLMDKPVGAVPGRFDSAQSAGCHELIRNNSAVLVSSAAAAIELVTGRESRTPVIETALGELEKRVFDSLSRKSITAEEIAFKTGLTSAELQLGLGSLELLGMASRNEIGWVKSK